MSSALNIPAPEVSQQKGPAHGGTPAEQRVKQLLSERKRLEKLVNRLAAENAKLRGDLHFRDEQIAQLKAEVNQGAQGTVEADSEVIAKLMAQGRELFPDWDVVLTAMSPGEQITAALGRCENGVGALYAMATGALLLHKQRQKMNGEQQRQQELIEHYRELHRQHLSP